MYTVARACAGPGDNELFDLLERRKTEIEAVMANSLGTSKLHAWFEPPRDFRRLQLLREWSHDEADEQQVFT